MLHAALLIFAVGLGSRTAPAAAVTPRPAAPGASAAATPDEADGSVRELWGRRIQLVSFQSRVFGRRKNFVVVTPPDYTRARGDWPVLYLFHGRGRTERSLVDDPDARTTLLKARMLVVLPDGDDGWYINSPVAPRDRYRDGIEEVMALADARYRLSAKREKRGLSGWSMGGYGCTLFACEHAAEFGALAPMIGLLDFPRTGLPKGFSYPVPTARFGSDPRVWTRFNPLFKADALRHTKILLVTGTQAFDRVMNENFRDELQRLDIACQFDLLPGGHTFELVRNALQRVIAFMNANLS